MLPDIDDDTLQRLYTFCGSDPRVPEPITRTVYEETRTRYWTPAQFIAEIQTAIEKIPPAKREDATVEFTSDYDEYGHLKITYEDVQTPDEVARNLERCLEHVRNDQRREREKYERLKAKYG
jgi:hypothetical protein